MIHRAVMLGQPLEHFPCQVQAIEGEIPPFQQCHQPQGLGVMVEAAPRLHGGGKRFLPRMAEGGVAEVMRQGEPFGQVFLQPQPAGDGAGDLRHFQRMGQARAEEITFVVEKDLRLVLKRAEPGGMDHPVTIALPRAARGGFGLGIEAATGRCGLDSVGCSIHIGSRPSHGCGDMW